MALVKIYTTIQRRQDDSFGFIARAVKRVVAAALNVPSVPTSPDSVETVFIEGIDLIGIDYILEVIAVERPEQQSIAESIIEGLNRIYPEELFSVYFNNISEIGMAHTPRDIKPVEPISMQQAIERCRS